MVWHLAVGPGGPPSLQGALRVSSLNMLSKYCSPPWGSSYRFHVKTVPLLKGKCPLALHGLLTLGVGRAGRKLEPGPLERGPRTEAHLARVWGNIGFIPLC